MKLRQFLCRVCLVVFFAILTVPVTLPAQSSLGSEEMPSWITTRVHPSYPPSLYVIGVASADSPEEACKEARGDIAAQLSVSVKTTVRSRDNSISFNDTSYVYSQLERRTKEKAEAKLYGVKNVGSYEKNGVFYCMAVLDKRAFSSRVRQELDDSVAEIKELVKKAGGYLLEGKAAMAVALLTKADKEARDLAPSVLLYNLFADKPFPDKDIVKGYRDQIGIIFSRIGIKRGHGVYEARVGCRLDEPLEVFVFYKLDNGGNLPLSGMNVVFRYGKGDYAGNVVTGEDGKAFFTPVARRGKNGNGNSVTITASVEMGEVPAGISSALDASVDFTVLLDPPIHKFVVRSVDESGRPLPTVRKAVSKALTDLGYSVIYSGGDWIVDTICRVDDSGGVSGFSGSRNVVSLKVEITVSNSRTGEKIPGSLDLRFIGIGSNRDEAVASAMKNMIIPINKLGRLLEEIADEM